MAVKKICSVSSIFLDENDRNEINKVLPQLAKRRFAEAKSLYDEWDDIPDQDFLEILESFNLSFAKEINNSYYNELVDISGFEKAIKEIDKMVEDYYRDSQPKIKAADFGSKVALEAWLDNCTTDVVYDVLINALWENRNSCIADRIVQAIAKTIY